MTNTPCPHCGHVKREKRATVRMAINLDTCSTAELFAERKRTAPAGDLAFLIAASERSGYAAIVDRGRELQAATFDAAGELTIPRAEFYRRYVNLQDAWRKCSVDADRVERIEAPRRAIRARVEAAILMSQVARERSKFLRFALHVENVPSEAAWLAQCAATVANVAPRKRRVRVVVERPAVAFVPF